MSLKKKKGQDVHFFNGLLLFDLLYCWYKKKSSTILVRLIECPLKIDRETSYETGCTE